MRLSEDRSCRRYVSTDIVNVVAVADAVRRHR